VEDLMGASTRPGLLIGEAALRPKTLRPGERSSERASERRLVRDDLSALLAHDLKTPLAAISMNLSFVLSELKGDQPDVVRSALEDCREANSRAIRIVSDMADGVRLAAGDQRPTFTEVAAALVVEAAAQRAGAEAAERGVRVQCVADETVIYVDPELLGRALDRLLERALRHARSGSRIEVEQRAFALTIRVETLIEAVAEPTARTLATYFADAAIRAQGGALWAETDGDGALVYRVALPRETP
jgi:K+-sensing histidine kinase KdpD